MPSGCGESVGEVLVNDAGVYVGDFAHGPAIDAPLGFSRSMAKFWGDYHPYCPSAGREFQCCSIIDWIFSPWWEPPYMIDSCNPTPQPLVPLSTPFGTTYTGMLNGAIVSDSSGPPHLEGLPAVELDLAGSGHGSLAFIGERASTAIHYNPSDYDTAWLPDIGSQWVWQVWAKTVPDSNDYTIPDGHLSFGYGRENTVSLAPCPSPDDDTLTSDWKFFRTVFTITPWLSDAHHAIPFISVRSDDAVNRVERIVELYCKSFYLTKWERKGRVRLKCAHLSPLGAAQVGAGNWCDSFHGHG